MDIAITQCKASNISNVDIMAVTVAEAVAVEFRVLNQHRAAGVETAQDAVFVVVKITVAPREVSTFKFDARAIAIRYRSTGKLHMLYRRVVALDHPDRLV